MIKVAVIDSFPVFQTYIGKEVDQQTDMQMVGNSSCGSDALALVQEKSPDVLVLGLNLDSSVNAYDPVTVIKELRYSHPDLRVILFSNKAVHIQELIEAGIAGYVLKHDPEGGSMIQPIRVVYNNEKFYSKGIRNVLSFAKM